jgi:hypothetical protein
MLAILALSERQEVNKMDESATASHIPREQYAVYSEDVIKTAETIKSRIEKDARGEIRWLTLEESLRDLRGRNPRAKH